MSIYEEWDRAEAEREERYDELVRQDEFDELLGLGRDFHSEEVQ